MLNYGASTNWAFARIGAMTGSNEESSLEAFGRAIRIRRWMDNVATDTELAGVFDRLSKAVPEHLRDWRDVVILDAPGC